MAAAKPVVTISAAYGAGGGFVGPRVAERLGVAFLDRAIPASVAADLAERPESVLAMEDELGRGLSHWLSFFSASGTVWAGIPPLEMGAHHDEAAYKEHIAEVLHREACRGAVILGRGAAIVLADHPGALHVRLDGPVEADIAQVMDVGGLDERTARRAQHHTDAARHRYIQRLYHADVADHRHYQLWIDATAVPLATCVEIIVEAVRGRDELRRLEARGDDLGPGG
ncbi:MAG: cytidylate kinase-like family protein [Actinomycetota bacterium]|nr:cytidylate kinase-like family protein [Actinomycetota bacterium]